MIETALTCQRTPQFLLNYLNHHRILEDNTTQLQAFQAVPVQQSKDAPTPVRQRLHHDKAIICFFNRKSHGKPVEKPWNSQASPAWEISDIELGARLTLSTAATKAAFATLDDGEAMLNLRRKLGGSFLVY